MYLVNFLCITIFSGFTYANLRCSELCNSGSCCKGDDDRLLCCPIFGGICCDSGNTCCPPGAICDSDGYCRKVYSGFFGFINRFTQPASQVQILTKSPPTTVKTLKSCSKICGDLCCPFENGVCCDDGEHCCPAKYKCDVFTQSCRLSMSNIVSVTFKSGRNCAISESNCSRNETCCILTDGSKGCCPYVNADCCADGAHCCPEGTVCSSDSTNCERKGGTWVNPFKSNQRLFRRKSVLCPDGKVVCHRGSTCCSAVTGDDSSYSCCPHENAVCCDDGEHCCPKGYTCDPSNGGTCIRSSTEIVGKSLERSKCKDGQTVCPDDNTCCLLRDGSYGCCPLPDAVCCEDHEHCCPNGYRCDIANGICIPKNKKSMPVPMSKKFIPSTAFGHVKMPECQSDFTPCSANGPMTRCPLKNAVCCSNGLHCCPLGWTCVENGYCIFDAHSYSLQSVYARAARLL